jgi:hypothetical protein
VPVRQYVLQLLTLFADMFQYPLDIDAECTDASKLSVLPSDDDKRLHASTTCTSVLSSQQRCTYSLLIALQMSFCIHIIRMLRLRSRIKSVCLKLRRSDNLTLFSQNLLLRSVRLSAIPERRAVPDGRTPTMATRGPSRRPLANQTRHKAPSPGFDTLASVSGAVQPHPTQGRNRT